MNATWVFYNVFNKGEKTMPTSTQAPSTQAQETAPSTQATVVDFKREKLRDYYESMEWDTARIDNLDDGEIIKLVSQLPPQNRSVDWLELASIGDLDTLIQRLFEDNILGQASVLGFIPSKIELGTLNHFPYIREKMFNTSISHASPQTHEKEEIIAISPITPQPEPVVEVVNHEPVVQPVPIVVQPEPVQLQVPSKPKYNNKTEDDSDKYYVFFGGVLLSFVCYAAYVTWRDRAVV